jgi:hypothetical protein
MMSWFVFVVTALLSFLSPWWLLLAIPTGAFKLIHWYLYRSRPWKRVHWPFLRLHVASIALEEGRAKREGREFDFPAALAQTLMAWKQELPQSAARQRVEAVLARCVAFPERLELKQYMEAHGYDSGKADDATAWLQKMYSEGEKWFKVSYLVGMLTEERYGKTAMHEYLVAVIRNEAT